MCAWSFLFGRVLCVFFRAPLLSRLKKGPDSFGTRHMRYAIQYTCTTYIENNQRIHTIYSNMKTKRIRWCSRWCDNNAIFVEKIGKIRMWRLLEYYTAELCWQNKQEPNDIIFRIIANVVHWTEEKKTDNWLCVYTGTKHSLDFYALIGAAETHTRAIIRNTIIQSHTSKQNECQCEKRHVSPSLSSEYTEHRTQTHTYTQGTLTHNHSIYIQTFVAWHTIHILTNMRIAYVPYAYACV